MIILLNWIEIVAKTENERLLEIFFEKRNEFSAKTEIEKFLESFFIGNELAAKA